MYRVTLTIENLDELGRTETYRAEAPGDHVLPLVFRVVNAAIAARSHEITVMTAAFKVISDAVNAAAPSDAKGGA